MSEIKLNRELFESEKTGVALDQDDSGRFADTSDGAA